MTASLINKFFSSSPEPRDRDVYVYSADIDGLDDMRDPELLWDQRRILRTSRSQTCLKQTLDNMRYRHAGKLVAPASVELEISAETVERDRRFGGQLVEDMLKVFTRKHAESFGDALPDGLEPRYAVRPSHDVPAGRMRIRTGPAIHVPQADERIVWKLQFSSDGVMWDGAPPVLLTERQRLHIISGDLDNASQICPLWPFDPQDGLVLLNQPGEARLDISSEPLGHLKVGLNDAVDCYVVRSADPALAEACLYLRATRLVPVALPDLPSRHGGDEPRLAPATVPGSSETLRHPGRSDNITSNVVMVHQSADMPSKTGSSQAQHSGHSPTPLRPMPTVQALAAVSAPKPGQRIEPVLNAFDTPAQVTVADPALQPSAAAALHGGMGHSLAPQAPMALQSAVTSPDDEPTMLAQPPKHTSVDDEATLYARLPLQQGSLVLEGLALQRPSQFTSAGVRGLQWGVDGAGGVVAPTAASAKLRFTVDAQDQLYVATAGGSRELRHGEPVPLKGTDLVLRIQPLPQPLPEKYTGWMPLPLGTPVRVLHGQRMAVGRNLESLKPLQPLAGPGFLPDVPSASGDRMGLSRQHFELEAGSQGLMVRPLGANTVAHLDAQMQFVAAATADQPAMLADGDCLVVGHYVWRFKC